MCSTLVYFSDLSESIKTVVYGCHPSIYTVYFYILIVIVVYCS